jgi:ABC-type methionine transport system ATPase subunit
MSIDNNGSGEEKLQRLAALITTESSGFEDKGFAATAGERHLDLEHGSILSAADKSDNAAAVGRLETVHRPLGYGADRDSIAVAFESVTLLANDGAATTRAILQSVTFQVQQGETLFVIGPSGAGKSRLLRLVNRLEEPNSGQVLLWGTPVSLLSPRVLRSTLVGFLSQQPALPCLPRSRPGFLQSLQRTFTQESLRQLVLGKRNARTGQVVEEPARAALETLISLGILTAAELEQRLPEALEIAGLAPLVLERPVAALSGGERARLGLARVLLQQPRILVLDEVTSSLDAATAAQILERLTRWKERTGATVLIVTHRLSEVNNGKLLLIRDGSVVLAGDTQTLLGTPSTTAEIHRLLAGEQPVESSLDTASD